MTLANFVAWDTGERQILTARNGLVVERRAMAPGEAVPDGATDLAGKTLAPAYIDNHCHILPTGLDLQKLHLGACATHAEVLEAVRQRHADRPDGWLLAVHYDQNRTGGGVHLTRHDLDAISGTRPILLRHVNGHASVANTAALETAGVRPGEPDPDGGRFGRDAAGALDGTLFEDAHDRVTGAAPAPTRSEMVQAILAAADRMADLGIGCASDMMTGRFGLIDELHAYREASERGARIRFRLYVQWANRFGPRAASEAEIAEAEVAMDPTRCRVAGIKLFADGAIGSATAAIYGRYSGEPAAGFRLSRHARPATSEGEAEVSGQLIYRPEKLKQRVLTADAAGYQVAIHAIGDYATDLVMDAYEACGDGARHRIEHAMILSDAQIERMARLGCFCTMQPEFLLRFGHAYRLQLGPERAARLKRARSVWDAGIPLSFSSDRPIVPGDPADGIRTAVHRPEGFDPGEAVTHEEAHAAYTAEAARANGDPVPALQPGDWADWRVVP